MQSHTDLRVAQVPAFLTPNPRPCQGFVCALHADKRPGRGPQIKNSDFLGNALSGLLTCRYPETPEPLLEAALG